MAFIDVSLEEVESSLKPHKSGLAHLRIEALDVMPNKKETAYVVNTRFKVMAIGGEAPVDDEGKPNESPVWNKYSLQPQALFSLANLVKATGKKYQLKADLDKEEDRRRVDQELKELLTGAEVMDILKNEEYEGNIRTSLSHKYKKVAG